MSKVKRDRSVFVECPACGAPFEVKYGVSSAFGGENVHVDTWYPVCPHCSSRLAMTLGSPEFRLVLDPTGLEWRKSDES